MRKDRIDKLNAFLDRCHTQAQGKPDSYFALSLNGLMWSFLCLGATVLPPNKIKAGLLRYLDEYTDALSPPSKRKHKGTKGFMSEPTRKIYIQKVENNDGDYNKRTYDQILYLTIMAGYKGGYNFSIFWESFCREYLLTELYSMLPSKDARQGIDPFWPARVRTGNSMVVVNVHLLRFYAIYGRMLHQLGKSVFNPTGSSFDIGQHIGEIDRVIASPYESVRQLMSMMGRYRIS